MSMGHVILKEFFVDRQVPYFTQYVSRYTDLPFLVRLEERDGTYFSGKFLTAEDLGGEQAASENAAFKTVLLDEATQEAVVPNGSMGHRYGEAGIGKWNLDLGDVVPLLSAAGGTEAAVEVAMPRFDGDAAGGDGNAQVVARGVPVRRVNGTWSRRSST